MIYYMVNSGLFQEEVIFLYCIEKKNPHLLLNFCIFDHRINSGSFRGRMKILPLCKTSLSLSDLGKP